MRIPIRPRLVTPGHLPGATPKAELRTAVIAEDVEARTDAVASGRNGMIWILWDPSAEWQ